MTHTLGFRLLIVSGSLRSSSTNTAVLGTLADVAPDHVNCRFYDELEDLPAFNPDKDVAPLPPAVERLRDAIHCADAIVFSTPEYAGALPGSFKNLLDWTIGDEKVDSIYDKPVGWINAASGAAGAYAELRTVLGYAHARIIDAACVQLPVTRTMIGPDGRMRDEALRVALSRLVVTLVESTSSEKSKQAGPEPL
jgi:NAD(P)H-dependent FMN reductase